MDDYKMIETESEYPFVVMATSYVHPLPQLVELEEFFKDNNYRGWVLVDALLSNGFSFNRFIKVYFDGKKFQILKSIVVDEVQQDLSNIIYSFYRDNSFYIDVNNILPSAQKYILKKGVLIKNQVY